MFLLWKSANNFSLKHKHYAIFIIKIIDLAKPNSKLDKYVVLQGLRKKINIYKHSYHLNYIKLLFIIKYSFKKLKFWSNKSIKHMKKLLKVRQRD